MLSLQTKIKFYDYFYDFKSEVILQLKDNTILLYGDFKIERYNKTFQSSEIIKFKSQYVTRALKQLKNNKILFCNGYLYLLDIKTKEKIVVPLREEILFDIIELDNGDIIGLTEYSLIKIKLEDKYGENKTYDNIIFDIPDELQLHSHPYLEMKNYGNLYPLNENKLLVHFFRAEDDNYSKCGVHPHFPYYQNKIYIVDIKSQKVLHEFEHYNGEINIVILKNYICISYDSIFIFDINDYKLIKEINAKHSIYIFRYDDNMLMASYKWLYRRELFIFNLSDINDIKVAKLEYSSKELGYNSRNDFKSKLFYRLKDGKILLNIAENIYIYKLPKILEFESYKENYFNKNDDDDYY